MKHKIIDVTERDGRVEIVAACGHRLTCDSWEDWPCPEVDCPDCLEIMRKDQIAAERFEEAERMEREGETYERE